MIVHDANVPLAILSRARADAARMLGNAAPADSDGLVLIVQMGQDAAL
jgi:hypothetical protein